MMTQALDRTVLDDLRTALADESGQFVTDLITVYGTQAGELVEDLEHAVGQSDVKRVSFAAHSLKGSSDAVGGRRLAALCFELEHWQGPASLLAPKVAGVREEVMVLRGELATYLSG